MKAIALFIVVLWTSVAAADMSTWRYGSPNDVRQAGIRAAQHYGGGGYGRKGGCQNPVSTWMDIAFRAGSPELYRYTQPAPAQINVYNNVTVYGSAPNSEAVGVIDYGPPPRATT